MALRRFVQAVFVLFLASVAAIGLRGLRAPSSERRISLAELSRHAAADDCWMAVAGVVYDVTSCVADHPTPSEELTRWCGREATSAFETKGQERPHGAAARAQLSAMRIGSLAE